MNNYTDKEWNEAAEFISSVNETVINSEVGSILNEISPLANAVFGSADYYNSLESIYKGVAAYQAADDQGNDYEKAKAQAKVAEGLCGAASFTTTL